ncbi:MAG: tRNA (adenosine(37)-N6)-threonylcarbamoyltransferase complex transferase subunit TsaD, partial [Butyrivibrio sp.]|nr:tRNA (adenosine(37)-N6)-threonylcarbamoyltransferase complex transferase subunit TsaD [Butyrivibrio sp.]
MYVLGIETSCDECSAAVVEDGRNILSNVIATQIELHRPFDGVVPELASRLHTEWISQVVNAAIMQAGIRKEDIGAIAATARPGLLGSLLVGLNFAKGMASV